MTEIVTEFQILIGTGSQVESLLIRFDSLLYDSPDIFIETEILMQTKNKLVVEPRIQTCIQIETQIWT